uniref:Odorant receptor, family A, subfamily 113, member 4 n=1 Tax=Cyclopterus lumpus TaxID=8103 RepID=A0A8C3AGM6_CYCLU
HKPNHFSDTLNSSGNTIYSTPLKVLLSMLPCFLFLYVNTVMLFALLSKPLLLESPRYILFGHLLITESLQLFGIMLLYIFAVTMIRMISFVCLVITMLARITVKISPLNLAVMSLERYVAVCFPLRHVNIFTTRMTRVAIAVMWTVASLDSLTLLFLFIRLENTGFTVLRSCHKHMFQLQMYSTINKDFTIAYFVLVCLVAIYTYIAVMITVKSASSTVRNSSKPHKTMLLHLIQLCLCLTSTLFNIINPISMWNINPALAIHIQYFLFLTLIIFPKCLSPLIYGLRDRAFRHVFVYYFTFGLKTFPKS